MHSRTTYLYYYVNWYKYVSQNSSIVVLNKMQTMSFTTKKLFFCKILLHLITIALLSMIYHIIQQRLAKTNNVSLLYSACVVSVADGLRVLKYRYTFLLIFYCIVYLQCYFLVLTTRLSEYIFMIPSNILSHNVSLVVRLNISHSSKIIIYTQRMCILRFEQST